jgi:hypothetical protein
MANYCTVDEVKNTLGQIVTEQYNGLLMGFIESATAEIDKYCRRSFAATTATRYFDGASDNLIVDDLITVTTLKLDTDGNGVWETTLTEGTDFLLYPYNEAPKWKVVLSDNSTSSDFADGIRKGVQIAGSWGYGTTIPDDIAQACLEMVCRIYRQAQAGFGTVVGTPDIGTGTVYQGLSSDIKRKLDNYVRHVYA